MKKCHTCGQTKGLKAIVCTGSQCDKESYHDTSICKNCYFDTCACEEDSHDVRECLETPNCPNHKETLQRLNHWDELDYHYQPKKGVVLA